MTMTRKEKIAYNKEVREKLSRFYRLFKKYGHKVSPETMLSVLTNFRTANVIMGKELKRRLLEEPTNKAFNRKFYKKFTKSAIELNKRIREVRNVIKAEAKMAE